MLQLILFILLVKEVPVQSLDIDCFYTEDTMWAFYTMYSCDAKVDNILTSTVVARVSSGHLEGRGNTDVRGFSISERMSVKFIPKGLAKFFPNIEALEVDHSDLEFLTEDDFEGLSSLTLLNMGYNKVTTIPSNFFAHTPKVRFISFSQNPLTTIAPKVFEPLHNLLSLSLDQSNCIDGFVLNNRYAAASLAMRAYEQCST